VEVFYSEKKEGSYNLIAGQCGVGTLFGGDWYKNSINPDELDSKYKLYLFHNDITHDNLSNASYTYNPNDNEYITISITDINFQNTFYKIKLVPTLKNVEFTSDTSALTSGNLIVSFNNANIEASTQDPIVSYTYDWGDGQNSTFTALGNTTHTYSTTGNYTVLLTVTTDSGMTYTFSEEIHTIAKTEFSLTLDSKTSTNFNLSWTPPTGATKYKLCQSSIDEISYETAQTCNSLIDGYFFDSTTSSNISINSDATGNILQQDTTYYFRVVAYDDADEVVGVSSLISDKLAVEDNTEVDLNKDLVAWYKFDGNTDDSSSNGNDGIPYGGVTYVDGVIGKAIKLGGYDNPMYVEVQNTNELSFLDNFTFAFWFNIQDVYGMDGGGSKYAYGSQTILSKSGDREGINIRVGQSTEKENYFDFWANDGRCCASDSYPIKAFNDINESRIQLNEWHFGVLKVDSSYVYIYSDGMLKNKVSLDKFRINPQMKASVLRIGIDESASWYPFNGLIDDLRIYNRTLNDSEIKELYKKGNQNTNTVLSYKDEFNDINKSFWNIVRVNYNWKSNALDYNAVTVEDGIINLYNDRTDDGPVMYSNPIKVNKGDFITVKRKAYVHSSNRHLNGALNIMSTNSDTLDVNNANNLCRISHVNETYQGDWNGFYLDNRSNTNAYITHIWDDWFVEELKYNTKTGEASYTVNNTTVSHTCKALGDEKNILFQIHNFGWYTGHYVKMDYIDIKIQEEK